MTEKNREAWVAIYKALADDDGYSPREIKAQAMAFSVLGYSSRQIERRLRQMFPGQYIPPWSTIARWNRSRPPRTLAARIMWNDVVIRACDLAIVHMERMQQEGMTPMQALKVYTTVMDVYDRNRF